MRIFSSRFNRDCAPARRERATFFIPYGASAFNSATFQALIEAFQSVGFGEEYRYDYSFKGLIQCLLNMPPVDSPPYDQNIGGVLQALADAGYGNGDDVYDKNITGLIKATQNLPASECITYDNSINGWIQAIKESEPDTTPGGGGPGSGNSGPILLLESGGARLFESGLRVRLEGS